MGRQNLVLRAPPALQAYKVKLEGFLFLKMFSIICKVLWLYGWLHEWLLREVLVSSRAAADTQLQVL